MPVDEYIRSKQSLRKPLFIAGCAIFAVLFIMAGILYKERVCLADTAFRTVVMIITRQPAIFLLRFGAFIPQLLPLTVIWLGAGLKSIMVANSLSFVVFFFAIYLVAFRISKQTVLFFLIPIYLIMLTNEEFYWPQSEYQQGMVWLCLYGVVLFERKFEQYSAWAYYLIQAVFIVWIQTFHPLIFIPMFFLLIYFYSSCLSLVSRRFIVHSGICIASFILRWWEGKHNWYENNKLEIGASFKEHLPHLFSLGSVREFWHKLPVEYAGYAIIFILVGCWMVYRRAYFMTAILILFSIGYWLLIVMACPEEGRFYSEYLMLPLGFMAALPLIYEILPRVQPNYLIPILLVFCTIRLGTIYHCHRDYTQRLTVYDPYFSYIEKHKLNGVIVDNKLIDQKQAIMTWGSGYESILISSLQSPDSCRVVQIDENISKYDWCVNYDTSLVTIYGVWGESELPKQYFRLRHGKYEILTKQP
jgi:hypothetical protein